MMDDKVALNSKIYTDIQGLQQLRYNYKMDQSGVKKEVAQQFESILMQMVMTSMRNANKAFESGLYGSSQMEMYQDLFDKQLSLIMSNSNTGFAKVVEKFIDQTNGGTKEPVQDKIAENYTRSIEQQDRTLRPTVESKKAANDLIVTNNPLNEHKKEQFKTPEDFVNKLWSSAKYAAGIIGTSPEVLIAQAALETSWGKNILPHGENKSQSSHSLFNIKADPSWNSKVTTMDTLEEKNGVLVKEKSSFRSYDSYSDSFVDYVNFLKDNKRYSESLNKASDPKQFVHALQDAGYATDSHYAHKILKIFSSPVFQNLVTKIKSKT